MDSFLNSLNREYSQIAGLELWAGIECTVNRVQNRYYDQIEQSGHVYRLDDLNLVAELGVCALRYPILWERFEPKGALQTIDWSWADERLQRLRELGIRPIVGLIHHGSGPSNTSLTAPDFAEGLAQHARRVAERFPWIEDWTPVNEPMTTARFSGLYGHWYPHGYDEQTFACALIQQCRAVALSMQAIRQVNPLARLIQTEDLGKIYSTSHLEYQAEFENCRRWLSWDLLCGMVDHSHRMWWHLRSAGVSEQELGWFLDHPCPPDVIGINHYLTSERYIDERLERYPSSCYGSNGRDRYADVEAIRVLSGGTCGIAGILQEAWERYKRPLAITEVHLGCTREEQMRWLLEAWDSARKLQDEGADVRAVTVWSLFGSYDWDSLLTRFAGHYESGVFDLRTGTPRPTALAAMMRDLAAGQKPSHPVLATAGWWHQSKRLIYSPEPPHAPHPKDLPEKRGHPGVDTRFDLENARPILIVKQDASLSYTFMRLCHHRHLAHIALTPQELGVADSTAMEAVLDRYQPWAIINASEGAETALLALQCAQRGIALLTFSSKSNSSGANSHLVIHAGAYFSPWDEHDRLTTGLRALAEGRDSYMTGQYTEQTDDALVSPTYVPDLVHACLDLLIDGEQGLWHIANEGRVTWRQLVQIAAERVGLAALDSNDARFDVRHRNVHQAARVSERPTWRRSSQYLQLQSGQTVSAQKAAVQPDNKRSLLLQPLEAAVDCYARDCGVDWSRLETAQGNEHISRIHTVGPTHRRVHKTLR